MDDDDFLQALNRLKHELRLSKDYEVAAALGLSKTAFAERKKRGAFPHKELIAFAASRPELDMNYVLTGVRSPGQSRLAELKRNFGLRLREIRETQGAAQLATILGTTEDELHKMEVGSRVPSREQFERLVQAFPDKSPGWLSGGTGPMLDSPLSQVETVLIANYRASSAEGQEAVRRQAAFHAEYNQRGQQG